MTRWEKIAKTNRRKFEKLLCDLNCDETTFRILNRTRYLFIRRCINPIDDNYHNYGARGITVCDEWMNDRFIFIKWALANGHKQGLQLDRENNDDGYRPGNCRWVDGRTNMNNTRMNVKALVNGKMMNLQDIIKKTGLSRSTILNRIKYYGPDDDILRDKRTVRCQKKMLEFQDLVRPYIISCNGKNRFEINSGIRKMFPAIKHRCVEYVWLRKAVNNVFKELNII